MNRTAAAGGPMHTRWAAGSLPDRAGLQYSARGATVLDDAVVGRQVSCAPGGRGSLGCNGTPHTQKNTLKPWLREAWCIPTVSAEFVWRMEDVLDLYAAPDDRQYPLVCFDEQLYQLVSGTRQALPVCPGQPRQYDYAYRREREPATCACAWSPCVAGAMWTSQIVARLATVPLV